ncbi:ATP-dependent helicase/nuclease subunit A [bioreactor metagenome]|uniref:ATP-dependent helicase/nuclease subunit A n=1 Tax=bioreactor metagenome TaxID=1076179 RepID=A0A645BMR6_9ZZZZ
MPESLIAGAKSYLDWLGPAVARHQQGIELRQQGECDEQPSNPLAIDASQWQVGIWQRQGLTLAADTGDVQTPLLDAVEKLEPVDSGSSYEWVDRLLGWQYDYSSVVGKPAKLSVTEIKRRFELEDSNDAHRPFERKPIAARPRFTQTGSKLTAAEYGTLIHSVMQHIDFRGDVSETGLVLQVEDMVRRELLLPEQVQGIDLKGAAAFFAGELGKRLIASPQVRRELPFSLALPAERFYDDLPDSKDKIFVQGIIDVLFDDPAGLVLIDYKTDRAVEGAELARKYAVQLNLYAEAAATILRRPVAEKYLYLFSTGQVVRVD